MLSNGIQKGPVTLRALTAFGRSCTSIYQLLPIYPAYDDGQGFLARVGKTTGIPNVDAAQAAGALAMHHEIINDANLKDSAYVKGRYRVFPIASITQKTLQSARLMNGTMLFESAYEGKDMSGDGTVPLVSTRSPTRSASARAPNHALSIGLGFASARGAGPDSGAICRADLGECRSADHQGSANVLRVGMNWHFD